MRVWRACRKARIHDLSGQGAKVNGGRWNEIGTPVVYASATSSLSILESLVHFPIDNVPEDYFLVELDIPDGLEIKTVEIKDLPKNWRDYPGPDELKEIGTKWAKSNKTVGLCVPSAVDIYAHNYILNPLNTHFSKIRIVRQNPFQFDRRLL